MRALITRTQEQKLRLRQYAIANDLPEDIYENFTTFAKYMVPTWTVDNLEWIWAHYSICRYFQKLIDGEISYLTLETHPQFGKSVLVSLLIIYVFGSDPDRSVMYFTYNEKRAVVFTKSYIFKMMGSKKYKTIFPTIGLKNDLGKRDFSAETSMQKKQSILADNEFNIINPNPEIVEDYRGKYYSFGIQQGSAGNPADVMILDDYVGKSTDTNSEIFRANLKAAFYDTIISRFQPSTIFVIVCTRWYLEDPIGQLAEKMADVIQGHLLAGVEPPKMESIKIRAEYRTTDDNLPEDPRTQDGEWLWLPLLSKYLLAKGEGSYEVNYNADPSDKNINRQIKDTDFGYYEAKDIPSYAGLTYLSIDGASTTKPESDFTSIGKWKLFGKKRYLIKLWYVKMKIPALERFVYDLLTQDSPEYFDCLIEYANSGVALYQYLQERGIKCTALGFTGKKIDEGAKRKPRSKKEVMTKGTSKVDRYIRSIPEFTNIYNDKQIFLPQYPIEHQDIFINQVTKFTGGKHEKNDMVDMFTLFINYTAGSITISASEFHVPTNNPANYNPMQYNLSNPNYFIGH